MIYNKFPILHFSLAPIVSCPPKKKYLHCKACVLGHQTSVELHDTINEVKKIALIGFKFQPTTIEEGIRIRR